MAAATDNNMDAWPIDPVDSAQQHHDDTDNDPTSPPDQSAKTVTPFALDILLKKHFYRPGLQPPAAEPQLIAYLHALFESNSEMFYPPGWTPPSPSSSSPNANINVNADTGRDHATGDVDMADAPTTAADVDPHMPDTPVDDAPPTTTAATTADDKPAPNNPNNPFATALQAWTSYRRTSAGLHSLIPHLPPADACPELEWVYRGALCTALRTNLREFTQTRVVVDGVQREALDVMVEMVGRVIGLEEGGSAVEVLRGKMRGRVGVEEEVVGGLERGCY